MFGFRGPHGGKGQPSVAAEWRYFRIEIDGVVVARDPADSMGSEATTMNDHLRPKWLALRPGIFDIAIRSVNLDNSQERDLLAHLTVEIPTRAPVIVAVLPETNRYGSNGAALLWSYRLKERERYYATDVRESTWPHQSR